MKWKHVKSISIETLKVHLINKQIPQEARIVFYDFNNPKIVNLATIQNIIGEINALIPFLKNKVDIIIDIYLPDLPKSNTEK